MIETLIISHLTAAGLRAYGEEPAGDTTLPYYVIQRTGGSETETLRRATVAVQSYGGSMLEAAQANTDMIAVMLRLAELDAVATITLNSDYNYTDTARRRYRYQAVFDITYYEEATR